MRQRASVRALPTALVWASLLAGCLAERYAEWSLILPESADSNEALPTQLQRYHRPLEWASPASILQPPKAGLFRVYTADAGGGIQATDSTSGVLLWSASALGRVWSKPAMHITVTAEITLDPEKGFVIMTSGEGDDRSRIRETMIVGSAYGVEAYHGDTGALQWKKAKGLVLATPLVLHASTQVVVATWAGEVLSVDAASGDDKWVQQMGENLWTAPYSSPNGAFVYILTENGKLSKLSTASGTAQWTTQCPGKSTPLSQFVILPQHGEHESLLVVSLDERVAAFSVATGSTVWSVPTGVGGGQAAALSVDAEHVLAIVPEGLVYTLSLDGQVASRTHWTTNPPLVMGTPVRLVSHPQRCITPAMTLVPERVARQQGGPGDSDGGSDADSDAGGKPAPVTDDEAAKAFEAAFGPQLQEGGRSQTRRLLGGGPPRDLRPLRDATTPALNGSGAAKSALQAATSKPGSELRSSVGTLRRKRLVQRLGQQRARSEGVHTSATRAPLPHHRQLLDEVHSPPGGGAVPAPTMAAEQAVPSAVYVQDGSGAVIDVLTGDIAVIPSWAGAGVIWTPSQSNDSSNPGFLVVYSMQRTLAAIAVSGCELPVTGSQASEVAGAVVVTRDPPVVVLPPPAAPKSSLISRLSLAGLVFICTLAALPFLVCAVLLAKVPRRLRARVQRSTGSEVSENSVEASEESISVHTAVRAVLPRSMGPVRSHGSRPTSMWTVPAIKLESGASQPITEGDDGEYVPASYLSSGLSMHPVSMHSPAKVASLSAMHPVSADHLSSISEARFGARHPTPRRARMLDSLHMLPPSQASDAPTSGDADGDSRWSADDAGRETPLLAHAGGGAYPARGGGYAGEGTQLAQFRAAQLAPSDSLQPVDSVTLRSGELQSSDACAESATDAMSPVGGVSSYYTSHETHMMFPNYLFGMRGDGGEGEATQPESPLQPRSTLMSRSTSEGSAPYSASTVASSRGRGRAATTPCTSPALRSGGGAPAPTPAQAAAQLFGRADGPPPPLVTPHLRTEGRAQMPSRLPRRPTPPPPDVSAAAAAPYPEVVWAVHAAEAEHCLVSTQAAAGSEPCSLDSPRVDARRVSPREDGLGQQARAAMSGQLSTDSAEPGAEALWAQTPPSTQEP